MRLTLFVSVLVSVQRKWFSIEKELRIVYGMGTDIPK